MDAADDDSDDAGRRGVGSLLRPCEACCVAAAECHVRLLLRVMSADGGTEEVNELESNEYGVDAPGGLVEMELHVESEFASLVLRTLFL